MDPKFNIGDDVMFSVAAREARDVNATQSVEKPLAIKYRPMRFSVVDVLVEQCYGGTQIHYSLRGAVADKDYGHVYISTTVGQSERGLFRAREIELEPFAP